MKSERTWVLIADAGRARILLNEGAGTGLAAVEGMSFENDTPPARALARDRPPRSFDSVGAGRHAMEPRTDPRREDKHDFARFLAAALGDGLARKAFDHAVLAAPPEFLGFLREELPRSVRAVVTAEIAKDLTRLPAAELEAHLQGVVRI